MTAFDKNVTGVVLPINYSLLASFLSEMSTLNRGGVLVLPSC